MQPGGEVAQKSHFLGGGGGLEGPPGPVPAVGSHQGLLAGTWEMLTAAGCTSFFLRSNVTSNELMPVRVSQ